MILHVPYGKWNFRTQVKFAVPTVILVPDSKGKQLKVLVTYGRDVTTGVGPLRFKGGQGSTVQYHTLQRPTAKTVARDTEGGYTHKEP